MPLVASIHCSARRLVLHFLPTHASNRCVCVCVRVCVCACVRVRVRVRARARACACVRVRACACVCVIADQRELKYAKD